MKLTTAIMTTMTVDTTTITAPGIVWTAEQASTMTICTVIDAWALVLVRNAVQALMTTTCIAITA